MMDSAGRCHLDAGGEAQTRWRRLDLSPVYSDVFNNWLCPISYPYFFVLFDPFRAKCREEWRKIFDPCNVKLRL